MLGRLELTTLYLCYLSLEHFSHTLHKNVLESNLLQGRYVFADYALTCWLSHLEHFLAALAKENVYLDLTSLVGELGHFLYNRFHESTTTRLSPQDYTDIQIVRPSRPGYSA